MQRQALSEGMVMLVCSHHHFLGRKLEEAPSPVGASFWRKSSNSIATEWGRFKIEVFSRFDQDALDPMKAALISKRSLLVPFSQS